ncbi:uncharacterized protein [Triticum aestivum]|uniref:uncharacterized protein isoform X7 n=1 Tax=Triticum aestivum TaxID=4565 RepID=UPI001D01A6CD|nr:uncharacterized protein LOC123119864 isoform X7 [Triticum aestivum]
MPPQVVHSRYPSPFTTANQCRSMRGRSTKAMVEVKTRCTSSSFVCFSVHLLPDARGRLAATTSHLFLSQRQQEKKGRFTSRCRPHHSHKETPASLPATRTSLTPSKVVPRGHVPLQRHGLCFSGKQWSLLEESWGRGPPAQQYNFLFCGRSLKELSAGRSKYMITNIRICMVPEKTFVGFLVAKYY